MTKIADAARKDPDVTINGILSMECTVRPDEYYHPHYHMLVDGRQNAVYIQEQWLKLLGEDARDVAQDLRAANKRSLKEIFKYATKLTVPMGTKNMVHKKIPAKRLDVIYQALYGTRRFRTYGYFRKIKVAEDENDELQLERTVEVPLEKGNIWKWHRTNWYETTTGEALLPTEPNPGIVKFWGIYDSYD